MLRSLGEGVTIAFDSLRANKLRSGLTILGVVIGVTTVMAIASMVQGIRTQIFTAIETAGPSVFYVIRFFSQTPLNPDHLPYQVRIRPVVSTTDAEAIRRVPEIAYAGMWAQLFQRLEYQGARTQTVAVFGADEHYMDIQGGTLLRGRFFTRGELTGRDVIVLETDVADRLFGQIEPLGRYVRVGDKALLVIGIYQKPGNIFEPPGQEIGGVMPFETARQNYRYDQTNSLFIAVRPHPGLPPEQVRDLATVALRRARGLRPGAPNTFDLVTQDQILDVIGKFTTYFFLAMVSLSSVALLVGGIGVMAIMMVSVTDRTREIGLRKALGATRREILWQFLVEAATLTFVGGLLGIVIGLLAGEVLKAAMNLESSVPLWSAALASGVSIGIGLVFGLYPANRAARMDPVEALRHE
ncbi:MAG TPA: ABC transporter permease [Gemmatimonadales bacterium]|jgi:putative ABC transport system permease protein|nr:ABC transporter permease [Gemmatimonadales bacterium]